MHHLLQRQLRRLLGADTGVPEALAPLLAVVSETYAKNDSDRALLEHSLQTVSDELVERYQRLEAQKAQQATLAQEQRRGAELALLNEISSLALSARGGEELLREILALLRPAARATRAEVWALEGEAWVSIVESGAALVEPPAAAIARRVPEIAMAVSALREATAATAVHVLAIEGEGLRSKRILLAVADGDEEGLSASLVASLEQHLAIVVQHAKTARALHNNAELLRGVTRGTSDVVFALDREGRYVMINPAGVRLIERKEAEILGATDVELFGPERGALTRAEDLRIERTGLPLSAERSFGEDNQRTFLVRKAPLRTLGGEVIGIVGVATDLTERKALEAQLLQSQKMEALGQLAGGVAHDFNNLLTVISGNLELLLGSDVLPQEDLESVTSALEAAGRARDLTSRLLAFGRRSILQSSVFEANELVRRMEPMIRRLVGETVHMRLALDPEPLVIRADRSQIEQMIVNLVVNARDAMPDGGTITITTRHLQLVEQAAGYLGLQPGLQFMLRVEDTGEGMDAATQARIFEPFFTTKAPGRGTGLGLSMVYSCVRDSGGHISVRSVLGEGTSFEILLPMSAEAAPRVDARVMESPAPEGRETILLVEDEPAVRRFASKVLEKAGYRVIDAENGSKALLVVRELGAAIDLLVSDVVMPEMGGGELITRARAELPALRVILMSGYTDDEMLRAGILRDQYRFLPKPFGRQALLDAVREALDASAS